MLTGFWSARLPRRTARNREETLMTAKKSAAASKKPAAKAAKPAKSSARKSISAKPAPKAAAKPAPKAAPIAKPAPKGPVHKPAAKPVTELHLKTAPKKPAAAAARAKPAPSKSFDPDRRLELIAAAAKRRKSDQPKAAPTPLVMTAPRQLLQTERHRFSVGDEVRVVSTSGMWFKHGIDYRVTAALPPQGGKLQYRIKNEQEPFERVVSESQLAYVQASAI
jgi:hypothetical protein